MSKTNSDSRYTGLLARAMSGLFLAKVVGSALALAGQVMLARLLGVQDFGDYSYVLACISLLLILTKLGLDKGAIRYVASHFAREEWGPLRGFISHAVQLTVISSFAMAFVLGLLIWLLGSVMTRNLQLVSWVACGLLPVYSLGELAASALQGLNIIVRSRALLEVVRPIVLTSILGAYLIFGAGSMSSYSAMAINLLAHACGTVAMIWLLVVALRKLVPVVQLEFNRREWTRTSLQLALIGGLNIVLSQTDILMVGALTSTKDAGIYSVASKIAALAVFGLVAAENFIAPMIAGLFAKKEMTQLQNLITLAARGTTIVTLFLSVAIYVFRYPILGAFGPEFLAATLPLAILLMAQAINASLGPVALMMIMTSHQGLAARVLGFSALMNVGLNAAFIPLMGSTGAALATATTILSWNILLTIFVQRRIGIRCSLF